MNLAWPRLTFATACVLLSLSSPSQAQSVIERILGEWNNNNTADNLKFEPNNDAFLSNKGQGRYTTTVNYGANIIITGNSFQCYYYVNFTGSGDTSNWQLKHGDADCPTGQFTRIASQGSINPSSPSPITVVGKQDIQICSISQDDAVYFALSLDGTSNNSSGWYQAANCVRETVPHDVKYIYVGSVGYFSGSWGEMSQSGQSVALYTCGRGTNSGGLISFNQLGSWRMSNGAWIQNCDQQRAKISFYSVPIGGQRNGFSIQRLPD